MIILKMLNLFMYGVVCEECLEVINEKDFRRFSKYAENDNLFCRDC